MRMDVQLCAFTFSAPPSANPTHPLGRNEATCATALFLLNTNTFQQNTKICTNTFQLLSCLPFYFCTRRHYKPYSNCFVTLLAVPANTQDSAKYRCCDLSNMTFLPFFSPHFQKCHQICVTCTTMQSKTCVAAKIDLL